VSSQCWTPNRCQPRAVLLTVGAAALHHSSARGATGSAQARSSSAIPWRKVGAGWTLVQGSDNRRVNSQAALAPDQLLLIDPNGTKYRSVPLNGHSWGLMDWDHRSERALLVEQWGNLSLPRPTDVLQVDLRTGAEQRFTAPATPLRCRSPRSSPTNGRSWVRTPTASWWRTCRSSVPRSPIAWFAGIRSPARSSTGRHPGAGLLQRRDLVGLEGMQPIRPVCV
jgi:hypothetical protein